jgi:hypothetical protein
MIKHVTVLRRRKSVFAVIGCLAIFAGMATTESVPAAAPSTSPKEGFSAPGNPWATAKGVLAAGQPMQ